MKIAILADIHGNALALKAVLADLKQREGADFIVNLGDCISGPLWPCETMKLLRQLDAITVRGNHDRQVATLPVETMIASDRYATSQITQQDREWLGALPQSTVIAPGIFACHATPDDDETYLIDRIENGGLVRDAETAISARLGNGAADCKIVLVGHSHRPDIVHTRNGITIINPDSVGCPAYDDDEPAHVSESGSPHARYALLTINVNQPAALPDIELIAVAYDHEKAAQRADENGRSDWAYAIRTGFSKQSL
ncbi:metallophosphoesterase [Thalassospira profundimaris]|uniref:Metallophosphoesterase n=1 Tax=Thalassospira profundimaris TaxID=502049 RepID=A0A367XDR5_9PROT|nr:metallophosphoesterase [Thalassospira profundimaris]RCK50782.1 metallophosphoesterase [Thalassospira profundimaris]